MSFLTIKNNCYPNIFSVDERFLVLRLTVVEIIPNVSELFLARTNKACPCQPIVELQCYCTAVELVGKLDSCFLGPVTEVRKNNYDAIYDRDAVSLDAAFKFGARSFIAYANIWLDLFDPGVYQIPKSRLPVLADNKERKMTKKNQAKLTRFFAPDWIWQAREEVL